MVNKKGFVYLIEIIFTVLIMLIIVAGFITSEQEVFGYKQITDLREEAWHTFNNLDESGVLDLPFTEIFNYTRADLPEMADFALQYYNSTQCYNVSVNGLGTTGASDCMMINTTTKKDIVSSIYTRGYDSEAESFRLYLWYKL